MTSFLLFDSDRREIVKLLGDYKQELESIIHIHAGSGSTRGQGDKEVTAAAYQNYKQAVRLIKLLMEAECQG